MNAIETANSNNASLYQSGMDFLASQGVAEDDRELMLAKMMIRGLVEAGVPLAAAFDAVLGPGRYVQLADECFATALAAGA